MMRMNEPLHPNHRDAIIKDFKNDLDNSRHFKTMLKKIDKLVHGDKEDKKDQKSKERPSIKGSGLDESSLAKQKGQN